MTVRLYRSCLSGGFPFVTPLYQNASLFLRGALGLTYECHIKPGYNTKNGLKW